MRWRLVVSALLCAGCMAAGTETGRPSVVAEGVPADSEEIGVASVLDGDSLIGTGPSDRIEVRLAGMNAPERDECLGTEARRALEDLAGDSLFIQLRGTDQFGRTLAQAWTADGVWVNAAMIEGGLAVTLSGTGDAVTGREVDALVEAQRSAEDAQRGLWAPTACGADGPRPSVTIEITAPDPPGPDDEALDDEYVTITNEGPAPVDLSGWTLRDESTANRLVFPRGSTIASGASIRVTTGCGGEAAIVAWCAERSVWNNAGDTAFLLDRYGRIIATDRYRP